MDGMWLESKKAAIFSAAAALCVVGYLVMGVTFTGLVAHQVGALGRVEQSLGLDTGAPSGSVSLPNCGTDAEIAKIRGVEGVSLRTAVAAACQGDPELVVKASMPPR